MTTQALSVTLSGADWSEEITKLVDARIASRIAAKDASIWGPEAAEEAAVRLNWTHLAVSSQPLVPEIERLRAELADDGVDRVVLCGMGGSSLAPEVITATAGVDLVVLDSTDPAVIARALTDLERTVVVVSSKSGGTVETDSQRRAFVAAFAQAGIDAASRMVVVTDPGSPLEKLATDEGYRKVFLADPDVGGRYSALTAFGLVPSGLAGADIGALLDQAAAVTAQLGADSPDNPALELGAAMGATDGRDKLLLVPDGTTIVGFADWAEQLIAESTGKAGRGVLPVALDGPDAPEVTGKLDDAVLALLTDDSDSAGAAGTVSTTDHKVPTATVCGPLGAQFLLWETATAVCGQLQGIDPFNQPDVESAKQAARGLLDEQPEADEPAFVDQGVEVRATGGLLDGTDTVAGAITTLTAQLGEDGYLAIMAYVDPQRDADLTQLRTLLARRTGRPVTFGWGPRFLHSTGQYHKGGRPQGVFLQITCDEVDDLQIPDRPFSFGTLISAQAAGDAGVLAERGRPVLRLHLTGSGGVAQVLRAAEDGSLS